MTVKNGNKVILVVGLGRFGQALCKSLVEQKNQVIAIDRSRQHVEEIATVVDIAIQADATDMEALLKVGAKEAEIAIVAIGGNIEASILATSILKDLGIQNVIARAQNAIHARVLARIGASRVVFPEKDMGERLAMLLVNPWMSHFAQLPGSPFHVGEIRPLPEMEGKTLAELDFRTQYNAVVLNMNRSGERFIPRADTVIEAGDRILVAGLKEDLETWVVE
ncbi:MAG: TrkA family potassium uptake protein [Thermovirgaceae bacterium]|nr:TrkA family potassium uptake protein [Thermovirgaceae bacterium]